MSCRTWLCLACLCVVRLSVAGAYSFDDEEAAHTNQAIEFDKAGDYASSLKAFQAALKYEHAKTLAERHTNVGVCLMRQERYPESHAAMMKAKKSDPASGHVKENIEELLKIMRSKGLKIPSGQDVAATRQLVEALYKEHNPDKLADLDKTMEKYAGKETRLLRLLREKYEPLKYPKKKKNKGPRQQYGLHVPRVTAAELAANKTLMSGHWPYILTGEASRWPATKKWTLDYLLKKIPREWVDYYPNNMYKTGSKPYVQPFEQTLPQFLAPNSAKPRYMQMRLSLEGFESIWKDCERLPEEFWTEAEWINKCMANKGKGPDRAAIDNFYRVNQWNFLLIGEKGTGIFFHRDHLAAASWQAAIVGRKKWILCPFTDTHLLDTEIYTFKPDYRRFPKYAQANCGKVVVEPGEIIYYPAYWWHQTKMLDTPTIGLTGLMVGVEDNRPDLRFPRVHEQFYNDLKEKCAKCWKAGDSKNRLCDDISQQWPGAAPPISADVCHRYIKRCFKLWDGKGKRDKLAQAARQNGEKEEL